MDFVIDKENKQVRVTREFAAPLSKVWAAYTQSELLDRWWAPNRGRLIQRKWNLKMVVIGFT